MIRAAPALAAILCAALAARADDPRPSEADLFGAPPAAPDAGPPAAAPDAGPSPAAAPAAAPPPVAGREARDPDASAATREHTRDDAILGGAGWQAGEKAAEDPLKIGGLLYLRSSASARERQAPSAWGLSAPTLVDGYLDARPNDRVRGFLLARMQYDPTIDPNAGAAFGAPPSSGGPAIALDQLWLRFDVQRRVFVTAGKQHAKWSVARFWTPTDFLHPVKRDPLAVFDQRTGTSMVRLHLPIESLGWNFYGVGLIEGFDPASQVGKVAGAARAEIVLGQTELGLDAIAVRGRRPRYGLDLSTGLGDFDLYAELGLRQAGEVTLYRKAAHPDVLRGLAGLFEAYQPGGAALQATGGFSWSIKLDDTAVLALGGEYFFNDTLGYDDTSLYPYLIYQGAFTPFYLGKHYAGLFALLTGPWNWTNTTFTLSTLGNLSDQSFITRLDYSVVFLTNLRLEAYGDVHYGSWGGEFRLGVNVPAVHLPGIVDFDGLQLAAPLFDLGVALRLAY